MIYRESILIGFEGIRHHKLRSILTALGIIFGVAAVVAMLSIGEGAKQQAIEQIQVMGMNNIIINDIPVQDEEEGEGRSNLSQGLTLQDAYSLSKINPLIETVVPQRNLTCRVVYNKVHMDAKVVGTLPDIETVMSYHLQEGGFFSYRDVREDRRLCVLGSEVKSHLFKFHNAIGKQIKIEDQWYTVVGVLAPIAVVGDASEKGAHVNQSIFINITSAIKRFNYLPFESEIDRITLRVNDPDKIQNAANIVNQTMARRHNQTDDYTITIPEALLKQRQQTQRIFNIVMGAIAGISLLVGGIGIMNIMLASVLERTREIGVRRAVGAKRNDILGQFLVEAVILSFVGGMMGVFFGFALTKMIALYAGWRTIVSVFAIFLAFSVSAAVGIIFGLYPAMQAAKVEPIVSLRYE
jgi:putative ABC transport system permease protein